MLLLNTLPLAVALSLDDVPAHYSACEPRSGTSPPHLPAPPHISSPWKREDTYSCTPTSAREGGSSQPANLDADRALSSNQRCRAHTCHAAVRPSPAVLLVSVPLALRCLPPAHTLTETCRRRRSNDSTARTVSAPPLRSHGATMALQSAASPPRRGCLQPGRLPISPHISPYLPAPRRVSSSR